jgi:hypothetical protein
MEELNSKINKGLVNVIGKSLKKLNSMSKFQLLQMEEFIHFKMFKDALNKHRLMEL